MSIYPVKLIEWYPKKKRPWVEKCHYTAILITVKYASCIHCGNDKMKVKTAWGHHSIPYGHGDVWCNEKCYRRWCK
jgi:hypothetical protein